MAFASVVRKPNSSCLPSTGALFGPLTPCQDAHRPAKANRGLSSERANHMGVLRGFVSAYSQNDVAGTRQRFRLAEPSLPVRAGEVADVRYRRAAVPRRPGHAPARHGELALAVGARADDRRDLIGEDPGKQREVARAVMPRAKPIADRGLAFRHRIEIAHRRAFLSSWPKPGRPMKHVRRGDGARLQLNSPERADRGLDRRLTAASGHHGAAEAHLAGCWRASIAIRRHSRARSRRCEYRATTVCGRHLSRLPDPQRPRRGCPSSAPPRQ